MKTKKDKLPTVTVNGKKSIFICGCLYPMPETIRVNRLWANRDTDNK